MEEKILEKKEKKKRKYALRTRQNRQVFMTIFLMASLILIILVVPFIKLNFIDRFKYSNLNFQKTKLGEIPFYSAKIPLSNINGQIIGSYPINFRNDPRELEYIEVNIPNNEVVFKKSKIVYISLSPEMDVCEDNLIAVVGFTSFLRDFGVLKVKGAMTNETYAEENKVPYATCENSPENTVIYLNSGNKTEIKKTSNHCYELIYNNCEMTQVTEKFALVILEDYMRYFIKK